ncbi:hypothetical protein [Streptomyces guryensis]|nr:hypothetical protein [Streptomyces guryensis]
MFRSSDSPALRRLPSFITVRQVCFFIPLAVIGRPLPGVSPAQQ